MVRIVIIVIKTVCIKTIKCPSTHWSIRCAANIMHNFKGHAMFKSK